MTHVQKYWTAADFILRNPSVESGKLKEIREWLNGQNHLPKYVTDEQLILFLHSCYFHIENTKKCIEEYYRLRMKVPQFFENRDINAENLEKALKVLHYSILPEKIPGKNYQIVFHKLNDTDPAHYSFNDGFKLLVMMIDAVYAREGPVDGLLLLFDLRGVKLGHVTKLPLNSVRRGLEYIQDAIPVRLKGIHVLNVHPIIDKIMMLVRPFLRKDFLSLLHFHKENDEEVYKTFPKSCLPKDYGGELETIQFYHDQFIKEMKALRPLFIEEEKLMFTKEVKNKKKDLEDINLAKLEID